MTKRNTILLIEDDSMLSSFAQQYLQSHQLTIDVAADAATATKLLQQSQYALIVLDLGLPDEDGLVLLRKWQYTLSSPIIVISARQDAENKIAALELGAADYITKPFSPQEFLLRLKRALPSAASPLTQIDSTIQIIQQPYLAIDLASRQLLCDKSISLTRSEFDILASLAQQDGKIIARKVLIDIISYHDKGVNPNSLGVLIHRLRKKLALVADDLELIVTVPNMGYRLNTYRN